MQKKLDLKLINKLREETGAPVIRVKKLLEELDGDWKKVLSILKKEGFEKAAKRAERTTTQGMVFTYVHHTNKIATMVELLCETDFVARNEKFSELGKALAMQLAFSEPKNVSEFEKQEFLRDPSKTVLDLVKELIAKTGENIRIGKFYRLEVGK